MGGRRGKRSALAEATTAGISPRQHGEAIKRQKREEYKNATGNGEVAMPKKKWFRQRAHANPFSDHRLIYPIGPSAMDWSKHYPAFTVSHAEETSSNTSERYPTQLDRYVEIADIGCGFGGLLFALAPKIPEILILGLEIRTSVTEFVENKIRAMRRQQELVTGTSIVAAQQEEAHNMHEQESDITPAETGVEYEHESDEPSISTEFPSTPPKNAKATDIVPGGYKNISVLRANTMKFLPNFFPRSSLQAIFLCFPDPHFKSRKHKARITSTTLNSEYAYALKAGGKVYTITDVEDLHEWMVDKFDGHESFERVGDEENAGDALVQTMMTETEEGKKVTRHQGKKFVAVWRRLGDPAWPGEED